MSTEKLKSGSYRYRFQIDGQKFSFTLKEKLSDRQALQIATKMSLEKAENSPGSKTIKFSSAAEYYLNTTKSTLSPSTCRLYKGYKTYIDSYYPWFSEMKLFDIDSPVLQRIINEYASDKDSKGNAKGKTRSAKTVKNFFGFILTVINLFNPGKTFSVRLPSIQKTEPYIPTEKDIERIFSYIKNTDNLKRYYVPLVLATLGLRRSEICALELDDLDGNVLSISKAKVKGENGWTIKNTTKTAASQRKVIIPEELADMIRQQGFIYKGEPCMLTETLERAQKKLNIPHFTTHKLRHFYATTAISLGVPILFIERAGGWSKGSSVLSRIYSHTQDSKKIKEMDSITLNHLATII